MPPEEPKKTNFEPVKVGLDPVFKGEAQTKENTSVGAGVYSALNNQQYTPSQTERVPTPIPPKNPAKIAIRTYKDDIQSAIQANHLSSVNIAIAENEKLRSQVTSGSELEEKPRPVSETKVKLFVSVLIILISVGGIAAGTLYFANKQNSTSVVKAVIPAPLFTTEYQDELNIGSVASERFVNALSSRLNDTKIPLGNIYNLYITSGTSTSRSLVPLNDLFEISGWRAPDTLKRNLSPFYMIGMYSSAQNLPFIIFKTSSYESVYAGMLGWESTLERDYMRMFRLNESDEGGLAASLTPSESKKFQDMVIANQDARALKSEDGKILFLYTIINKDTIIIAKNDVVLKELINRLNREKSLKR